MMVWIQKNTLERVCTKCDERCRRAAIFLSGRETSIMFFAGVILLVGGMTELAEAQNGGTTTQACGRILEFIETGFGALVASAAGLGAIISAAVGGFRAAWSLLVVSIGSFILRSYLTLFHSPC